MDDGNWNTERLITPMFKSFQKVRGTMSWMMEYVATRRKGDTTYLDYYEPS